MKKERYKKRYESIMKRDFKYNLELYLFDLILNENEKNATPENFKKFKPGETLITNYRQACQQHTGNFEKTTISEIDKRFKCWYEKSNLKEYKDIFYEQFADKLKVVDFKNIFNEDLKKNQCHYCGLTEADIENSIENKLDNIKTRRLLTRGRSMEIDRIDPSGDYSKENIVLCCYWCNNAKTDEFSYFEFKKFIAPEIQEIWEIRLQRKLNPPEMKDLNDKTK